MPHGRVAEFAGEVQSRALVVASSDSDKESCEPASSEPVDGVVEDVPREVDRAAEVPVGDVAARWERPCVAAERGIGFTVGEGNDAVFVVWSRLEGAEK